MRNIKSYSIQLKQALAEYFGWFREASLIGPYILLLATQSLQNKSRPGVIDVPLRSDTLAVSVDSILP